MPLCRLSTLCAVQYLPHYLARDPGPVALFPSMSLQKRVGALILACLGCSAPLHLLDDSIRQNLCVPQGAAFDAGLYSGCCRPCTWSSGSQCSHPWLQQQNCPACMYVMRDACQMNTCGCPWYRRRLQRPLRGAAKAQRRAGPAPVAGRPRPGGADRAPSAQHQRDAGERAQPGAHSFCDMNMP